LSSDLAFSLSDKQYVVPTRFSRRVSLFFLPFFVLNAQFLLFPFPNLHFRRSIRSPSRLPGFVLDPSRRRRRLSSPFPPRCRHSAARAALHEAFSSRTALVRAPPHHPFHVGRFKFFPLPFSSRWLLLEIKLATSSPRDFRGPHSPFESQNYA